MITLHSTPRTRSDRVRALRSALPALFALVSTAVPAATAQQLMAGYAAQSQSAPDPARGRQFFTADHGHEWRCASCHGPLPVQPGRHQATGKTIGAMAPAVNPERFTDAAKTEKWFRRNCHDVVGRACTPAEKADVLSWLVELRP